MKDAMFRQHNPRLASGLTVSKRGEEVGDGYKPDMLVSAADRCTEAHRRDNQASINVVTIFVFRLFIRMLRHIPPSRLWTKLFKPISVKITSCCFVDLFFCARCTSVHTSRPVHTNLSSCMRLCTDPGEHLIQEITLLSGRRGRPWVRHQNMKWYWNWYVVEVLRRPVSTSP